MKLTAKQEKFCQGIVAGLSQADAYRQAYDAAGMKAESIQVNASKLMANAKVALRVDELRQPVMEAIQYGLKEAMDEADEAFMVAKSKGNGGAMVAAATLRARLNGLLKDRVDTNVTGAVNVHVTFG